MRGQYLAPVHGDLIVSLLRAQIGCLVKVVQHIEQGNSINEFVDDNIKRVEKDLRWLRNYYFNV